MTPLLPCRMYASSQSSAWQKHWISDNISSSGWSESISGIKRKKLQIALVREDLKACYKETVFFLSSEGVEYFSQFSLKQKFLHCFRAWSPFGNIWRRIMAWKYLGGWSSFWNMRVLLKIPFALKNTDNLPILHQSMPFVHDWCFY